MRITELDRPKTGNLDSILAECCRLVIEKNKGGDGYWGMVGACVVDSSGNTVYGVNHEVDGGRDHAEVVAIKRYIKAHGRGDLDTAVVVTTLSPCSTDIDQPGGRNCVDYIEAFGIKRVYCGYTDPTQDSTDNYMDKGFTVEETGNSKLRLLCKKMAETFLK